MVFESHSQSKHKLFNLVIPSTDGKECDKQGRYTLATTFTVLSQSTMFSKSSSTLQPKRFTKPGTNDVQMPQDSCCVQEQVSTLIDQDPEYSPKKLLYCFSIYLYPVQCDRKTLSKVLRMKEKGAYRNGKNSKRQSPTKRHIQKTWQAVRARILVD